MNSRERVIEAINHRQPDRVPLDLGSTINSSIVVEGYERLKQHFGIQTPITITNRMMRTVEVDEEILRALEVDFRGIICGAPFKGLAKDLGDRQYRDQWGCDRIHPEGSYYYDLVNFPLSGNITISDIAKYPWPDPDDPGWFHGMRERLNWIRENTDCAAVLGLPPPFVHISQYLRGFEEWYLDVVLNTAVLEALFDAVLEVNLQTAKNILGHIGKEVDIIICSDDLGAQHGLQISPDHYSKLIKPRHEKYFRLIHEMSPAKLLFHSCGSVADIIPDLIDMGVDILNPVQVSAAKMDPLELKTKYQGKIVFWGALDTQQILPYGSVADVKKMVEERIEQMADGGGYVVCAVHNIQPDVPLENILAMYQHAREYVPSFA